MLRYILKRLVYGFLVIVGVVIVVFFLFHTLPGDPVDLIASKGADKEMRENLRHELGLDQPILTQFVFYVNDLSPLAFHKDTEENQEKYRFQKLFDFGSSVLVVKMPYLRRSFISNRRVDEILIEGLIGTMILGVTSMLFATIVGIILGLIAAVNQGSFWDYFMVTSSVVGISAPSFVSAILIAMTFGFYLSEYTGLSMVGYLWIEDPLHGRILKLENLILPSLALGIRPLSIITQLTRNSMLEVLSQDYIRTAYAKGLGKPYIILKHALRNALNPVVTTVSSWMVSILGGAFFIEYIFQWKGLGLKTIQAVERLDLPVVMGSTLIVAVVFVIISLLSDIVYGIIDPRVRLR